MIDLTNLESSTAQQSIPSPVFEYLVLYDGEHTYTVSSDFYNSVRYQVEGILPALIPGEKYNLKMLCGDEFWNLLSRGERRMAGRCMVDMVNKGHLPLRFAKSRHEYPKYYQLK